MQIPKNVVEYSFGFYKYGVKFYISKDVDGTTDICTGLNATYTEDGANYYDQKEVLFPRYVFADLNTVIEISENEIKQTKNVPVGIHKRRLELLERFHKFYTDSKITVDAQKHGFKLKIDNNDFLISREDCLRYFKEDGSFKSNNAFVRFFCAIEGDLP